MQIIVAFVFGVAFVITLLVLAVAFPTPTHFQYNVFRVVLSLAAAGVAAMIPGFIDLELSSTVGLLIRAGGALAVFVIVFFFNPAGLATHSAPDNADNSIASNNSTPCPTLIVSHYSPNETEENKHLCYRSSEEDGKLRIHPDDSYLDLVRTSGELTPLHFTYSPWEWKFAFPALDLKLVNNTVSTLFFHEVEFVIRESKVDLRPIPIIDGDGYNMRLPIGNIGWGPMHDAVLRFTFFDPNSDNYPYEFRLGTFKDTPNQSSLKEYFARAGVDFELLDALQIRGSDGEWLYFDADSEYGEPFDARADSFCSGGKRMTESDYEQLQQKALGPFPSGDAHVTGVLEYDMEDLDGQVVHATNPIRAYVRIFGPPAGAPAPPTFSYNVRFKSSGKDYSVKLPISHSLKAGETDRFVVHIAADKSSYHEFDVVLRYNNSQQVISRPIALELFLSRLDAKFVDKKPSDPLMPATGKMEAAAKDA